MVVDGGRRMKETADIKTINYFAFNIKFNLLYFEAFLAHGPKLSYIFMKKENEFSCFFGQYYF